MKETEPFTITLAPLITSLTLVQASSLQERTGCGMVPLSDEHTLA